MIAHAAKLDDRALGAMATGLARGLLLAAGDAQKNFIQDGPRLKGEHGPGARLHNRSGTLRKSINTDLQLAQSRVVGRIGSVLKYAAYHEFGFHGVMNVRAHTRVTDQIGGDGKSMDTRRVWATLSGEMLGFRDSRKAASRNQRKGFVMVQFVRAHSRRVDYLGKPFIRPALDRTDVLGEVKTELKALNNG